MRKILLSAALIAYSITPLAALEANVTKATTSTPAKAWATVGDFCNIASWHPAVKKCDLSQKNGATFRTLTLGDGAKLLEKLVARDDKGMSYSYTIEEGPLPVVGYKSTIKVLPRSLGATFEWTGTFEANGTADSEAIKLISGIYTAGIDALVKVAEKDATAEINKVNREFEAAMQGGDADRLSKVYTSDGEILPPNSMKISGRDGIRKFWDGVLKAGISDVALKSVELTELGDTAIEVGRYKLKTKSGSEADSGKYIVIWKLSNGTWKWHRDIWNSSRPTS